MLAGLIASVGGEIASSETLMSSFFHSFGEVMIAEARDSSLRGNKRVAKAHAAALKLLCKCLFAEREGEGEEAPHLYYSREVHQTILSVVVGIVRVYNAEALFDRRDFVSPHRKTDFLDSHPFCWPDHAAQYNC